MAIRGGRIALIEHEAAAGSRVGGHTIERHIAKTEAELRGRLAAQGRIRVASSFHSLEIAERSLYQGLRANRAEIVRWARTAPVGDTKPFEYIGKEVLGHGVVRASGQLVSMRGLRFVLKNEAFNGKLYYILTAFPIP